MVRQKKKASRNLSFNVESDLHNANMSVKHHLDGYSDDDAGGMMDTWSSAIFGGDSFITNLNSNANQRESNSLSENPANLVWINSNNSNNNNDNTDNTENDNESDDYPFVVNKVSLRQAQKKGKKRKKSSSLTNGNITSTSSNKDNNRNKKTKKLKKKKYDSKPTETIATSTFDEVTKPKKKKKKHGFKNVDKLEKQFGPSLNTWITNREMSKFLAESMRPIADIGVEVFEIEKVEKQHFFHIASTKIPVQSDDVISLGYSEITGGYAFLAISNSTMEEFEEYNDEDESSLLSFTTTLISKRLLLSPLKIAIVENDVIITKSSALEQTWLHFYLKKESLKGLPYETLSFLTSLSGITAPHTALEPSDWRFNLSSFLAELSVPHTTIFDSQQLTKRLINNGIRTQLRKYQTLGVAWMLSREALPSPSSVQPNSYPSVIVDLKDETDTISSFEATADGWISLYALPLPQLMSYKGDKDADINNTNGDNKAIVYSTCFGSDTEDPEIVWYDTLNGRTTTTRPGTTPTITSDSCRSTPMGLADLSGIRVGCPTGGILADEMGIGKTLQVISLIALSSRAPWERLQLFDTDLEHSLGNSHKTSSTVDDVVNEVVVEEEEGEFDDTITSYTTVTATDSSHDRFVFDSRGLMMHGGMYDLEKTAVASDNSNGTSLLIPCFCGRTEFSRTFDLAWVNCAMCHRRRHAGCAGIRNPSGTTGEELNYICFSCRCSKLSIALNRFESGFDLQSHEYIMGGTLVVVPDSLIHQWQEQIKTHTDGHLKVFVYEGVNAASKIARNPQRLAALRPDQLSKYDMVITSFQVLQDELARSVSDYVVDPEAKNQVQGEGTGVKQRKFFDAVNVNEPRQFRSSKRYEVIPSPLTCIRWWRLCLDEAQEVESQTSNKAMMAIKLSAVHRWCISGTPLGHGKTDDLQALARFFRLYPLDDKKAFGRLVQKNVVEGRKIGYARLYTLFRTLVLRRTQVGVTAELGLKPQIEVVRRLHFSSIERHRYRQILDEALKALTTIECDSSLLSLRKICCHPQLTDRRVGHGEVLSMSEVVMRMIDDSRQDCEEKQRTFVFYLISATGVLVLAAQAAANSSTGCFENVPRRSLLELAKNMMELARNTYERNRKATPLTGTAKLDGPLLVSPEYDNDKSYASVMITDSLSFQWADLDEVAGVGVKVEEARSTKCPLSLGDQDPHVIMTSICDEICSNSTTGIDLKDIVIPHTIKSRGTDASMGSVKVEFPIGRRILHCRIKISLQEHVRAALRLIAGMDCDSTLIDGDQPQPTEILVFFPAKLVIQGTGDAKGGFLDICRIEIPNPLSCNEDESEWCDAGEEVFGYSERNRSWRVLVEEVYDACLLLRRKQPRNQHKDDQCPLSPDLVSYKKYTSANSSDVNSHIFRSLHLQLQLQDATFDIDPFQEIHTKHKLVEINRQLLAITTESISSENLISDANRGPRDPVLDLSSWNTQQYLTSNNEEQSNQILEDAGVGELRNYFQRLKGFGDVDELPLRDTSKAAAIQTKISDSTANITTTTAITVAPAASDTTNTTTVTVPVTRATTAANDHDSVLVRVAAMESRVTELRKAQVLTGLSRQQAARLRMKELRVQCEEKEKQIIMGNDSNSDTVNGTGIDRTDTPFGGSGDWWWFLLRALGNGNKHLSTRTAKEINQQKQLDALSDKLVDEIRICVECNENAYAATLGAVRNANGLALILSQSLTELEEMRSKCNRLLDDLPDTPSSTDVSETGDCKRCCASISKTGPVCKHCRRKETLKEYEDMLYAYKRKIAVMRFANDSDSNKKYSNKASISSITSRRNMLSFGLSGDDGIVDGDDELQFLDRERVDGLSLMLLNMLRRFIDKNRDQLQTLDLVFEDGQLEHMSEEAAIAVERMELLQKEAIAFSTMWQRHLSLLFLYDEVAQATSSLRLVSTEEWENTPANARSGLLREFELNPVLFKELNNAIVEQNELIKKVSHLTYCKSLELENRERQLRKDNESSSPPTSFNDNPATGTGATSLLCTICLDPLLTERAMLPCGHCNYHGDCLTAWIRLHPRCPTCKQGCKMQDMEVLSTLDPNPHTRSNIEGSLSPLRNNNGSLSPLRNHSPLRNNNSPIRINATGHDNGMSSEKENVYGEWGVKVDELVRDLLLMKRSTTDKAVVFASWVDMLNVVGEALTQNNIRFEQCISMKDFKSGGSLSRFRSDAGVRVLLLDLNKGAHGLTLTEANRVMLLHPVMNPQQEAQAINRVHRIGQMKQTYVYKYLVGNTVEMWIHDWQQRALAAAGGVGSVLGSSTVKAVKSDQATLKLQEMKDIFTWNQSLLVNQKI